MVRPGIWRETLKNIKNEKCTPQDMDYGKKNEKTWKMRHTHCATWNMARKSKKKSEK